MIRLRSVPEAPRWPITSRLALSWGAGLPGAAIIATGLVWALARPLPNSHVVGYTALWATRDPRGGVDIGVHSAELGSHTYRVVAATTGGSVEQIGLRLDSGQATLKRIDLYQTDHLRVRIGRLLKP